MTRPNYSRALDGLLRPLGFRRDQWDWVRIRGEMWECVNLQASWHGGVTVNVRMKDLETERILEAIRCEQPLFMWLTESRIGHLIDGYDRWWKKEEPDGPADLVDAVRTFGLPWFDKVRSIEDQAAHWYGSRGANNWRTENPLGRANPWRSRSLAQLAVTLYRMGELEEARRLFEAPVPKTAISSLVIKGRCVEQWLDAQSKIDRSTD